MINSKYLLLTASVLTLASFSPAAYADGTAECNAGASDPTSLECGINTVATGPDATAIGTEA